MPAFASFFRRRHKPTITIISESGSPRIIQASHTPAPVSPSAPKIQAESAEGASPKTESRRRKIWHKAKASFSGWQLGGSPTRSPSAISDNWEALENLDSQSGSKLSGSSNTPVSKAPSSSSSMWTPIKDGSQGEESDDPEQYNVCPSGDQDQFLAVSSPTSTPIKKSHGGRWKGVSEAGKVAGSVAKYGVQMLKESSDVLPPLKSVAGGLSFFLSTYEQWVSNKDDMKRLLRRLEHLQAKFQDDEADPCDFGELQRRTHLTMQLQEISRKMEEIQEHKGMRRFIEAGNEAKTISGFVDDIRDAILEYQVSLQMFLHKQNNMRIALDEMRDLQTLPRARNASHFSEHHRYCLKGTRVEVLQLIENWTDDDEALRVYWLNGHAGSGKSTIAQSFSKRMFADRRLGASFFCSRDFADRSELHFIFPTLAFQLACQFPAFRRHIVNTLRLRPDIGSESLTNQLTELIIEPLEATNLATLIVIDALDECKDDLPASAILSLLARYIHRIPRIKWFITGRPEAPIRTGFRLASLQPVTRIFILHDVKLSAVEHDIELYLRTRLSEYVKHRSNLDLPVPWPSDDDMQVLVKKANGLFIFVVTAVTFITSQGHMPDKQLALITGSPEVNIHEGRSGLDILYSTILERGYGSVNADEKYFSDLRGVWGYIVTAFNPLSRNGIATLLEKAPNEISTSLRLHHAVLRIPKSKAEPVRVYHKSFPDYLTNPTRCTDSRFFLDAKQCHTQMAISCLKLMCSTLKRNICAIKPFAMNRDMPLSQRRQNVGESLEYACRFWAQHLAVASDLESTSETKKEIFGLLHKFFDEKVIFWLEVLSLTENLHSSVYSLSDAKTWSMTCPAEEKRRFTRAIRESERFILQFFDCIQESAMHLYHSALPQSPKNSDIYTDFYLPLGGGTTVRKGLESKWKSKTRTIVTRLHTVTSLKFSSDGSKVAAGGDGGLQVFDTTTGECLATMPAPENCISVEFSHDASFLLTTYAQHGIRLWDVQTGGLIRTCKGHESRIWDASFSPSGTHFASVDELGHILVWNVENGGIDHTFQADCSATRIFCKWCSESTLITHSSPSGGTFWHDIPSGTSAFHRYPAKTGVSILNNTHNGLYIVERDRDHLRIFDAVTLKLIKSTHGIQFPTQPTTQGFQNMDLQIASLSLDEHHFVLLKPLHELCLYRVSTDTPTAFALEAATSIYHSSPITSAFFSPDSSQIAFGSEDGTIILSSLDTNYDDSKPATAITCVCTSPNGELCAYSNRRAVIEVCSILTGDFKKSITASRIWRGIEIETMAFSPRNEFLAIHYKKIVTVDGNQHVRLGLLIWDIIFDRKYSQPELLIPTTSILPHCELHYFEGYEGEVAGLAGEAFSVPTTRSHLEHTFFLRVLYFNNSITFQVWGMSPLHLRWDSGILHTDLVPKWPLSVRIHKPKITVQYGDDTGYQVWEITFDEKNSGFKTRSQRRRHWQNALRTPSHCVFGDNWILNEAGDRIFWVPYEVALPNSDWHERARWVNRTLILGGREGRMMIVDFKLRKPFRFPHS